VGLVVLAVEDWWSVTFCFSWAWHGIGGRWTWDGIMW
jgi:hypothetical protein